MTEQRRIVIDVDAGTDDYLAILMFLRAEELGHVKIEAIVCSTGNTTVHNVCRNVVRLLELVSRLDIPVYRGAFQSLILSQEPVKYFHGSDGFGCLEHAQEPDTSVIRQEPPAVAIGHLVLNNPDQISLICLGPLTNIAITMKLYENFASSLKDMWIMGGNYTATGNITSTAEYNFYMDPEAAYIVLENTRKPTYILTWETCLLAKITFDWRYDVFGRRPNPAIQLLNRADRSIYPVSEKYWYACDALAAAACLYGDDIIMRKSDHYASVELHGSQTRGQIVLDHLKTREPNVTIIEEVNCQKFKDLLMEL